jgi:hypothetical protein
MKSYLIILSKKSIFGEASEIKPILRDAVKIYAHLKLMIHASLVCKIHLLTFTTVEVCRLKVGDLDINDKKLC